MRKKLLVVTVVLVGLSLAFPPTEAKARGGWGWGVGAFTGGLLLGTAISHPWYPPPPVYVYPPPPVYVYPPATYYYTAPPPVYVPNQAYAYPDPASSPPPPPPAKDDRGAGQWVEVPGQYVDGRWVPPHRAWAPGSP